jgi:hypothetical protein
MFSSLAEKLDQEPAAEAAEDVGWAFSCREAFLLSLVGEEKADPSGDAATTREAVTPARAPTPTELGDACMPRDGEPMREEPWQAPALPGDSEQQPPAVSEEQIPAPFGKKSAEELISWLQEHAPEKYVKDRLLQICEKAKGMQSSDDSDEGPVEKADPSGAEPKVYPWSKLQKSAAAA